MGQSDFMFEEENTMTVRTNFMLTTCLSIFVCLSAPAHAQRFNTGVEARVDALEQKIERLNRMPVGNGTGASSGSLSSFQVEISQMKEDLRAIRGGIEENRYAVEQLQREMKLSNEDMEYRVRALEEKNGDAISAVPPSAPTTTPSVPSAPTLSKPSVTLPTAVPPISPKLDGATPPVALPPTNTTPVPPAPVVPLTPSVPSTSPVVTPVMSEGAKLNFTDPSEHYNYGVSQIKNKQYPEARETFKGFVTTHKQDKLAGNAYYWLGETYYVNSDFVTAADTFRQGFEVNPNGIKAPDNLYKLAKSLLHLDKKQEACIVLGQIQKRYKTRNPEVVGLAFETQKANSCQ
jgi:tol-pal system protein YbgF